MWDDICLSRLLNYTGWCHSNQGRAPTQVLGLLGPTDYFANLGGGRDGIFLITRHSNVMFSLVVTPPPPPINVIVKNIKCVLFYFRIINGLCLPTSQWQRRTTVQNCRKINMWKLSMEKKREKNTEFPVVFFWNCSAYVTTCIIYSIESRATAVPDVSNLD